jgi:ABC-type glutathione transport system ATPase component
MIEKDASGVILRVENLCITIHANGARTPVVRGASLQLEQGRILGLVGESGGGKTMVCKAILGVLPESAMIEAGSIAFEGRELLAMPKPERRALLGRPHTVVVNVPYQRENGG